MGYNNSLQSNYKGDVKTAQQWHEFIAGGRNKQSRKVANNTTVRRGDDQAVAITLHSTDIVIIAGDGTARLDSGGWRSVTTKERINRYTNAGISQRNSIWYMGDGSLYYDGMVIRADGTPVKPRATDKYEKQVKAIKKQAKKYAHDFVVALEAGAVDFPSGGDCWACAMRGPEGQETFKGSGHLQDHIKESYFVPSLLVNAGREAGYRDDQIGMMGIGGRRLFINPEHNIYRYMVKHLQEDL